MFISNKDSTLEDTIPIVTKSSIPQTKFKSPGKAMLYSAVFPGLGQVYMGKWKRGLVYLALEGIAAGVLYQNNILAEKRKKEYFSYAENHWDFARWIHDYYKWYEYRDDDLAWNSIRAVFLDDTETYTDIWKPSHGVEFTWDGEKISSNSNAFYLSYLNDDPIISQLCGNDVVESKMCENDIEDIEDVMSDHSVYVSRDYHFYEGIQKYDSFFAGWDDNDKAELTDDGSGDIDVTSPRKSGYQSIYSDSNNFKKLAGRGGNFMLINRFISIIDGLFLAKKWNTEHVVKLNLDVYPDLRNKLGVGGLKFTMGWK